MKVFSLSYTMLETIGIIKGIKGDLLPNVSLHISVYDFSSKVKKDSTRFIQEW